MDYQPPARPPRRPNTPRRAAAARGPNAARRTNAARRAATRAALLAAARDLFAQHGYAETATPDIVAAAGVTRGALYHHFEDKAALFAGVVAEEQAALMRAIEDRALAAPSPLEGLIAGGEAFLDALDDPGRLRILLIDAPSVLGPEAMETIDDAGGRQSLAAGLKAAVDAGQLGDIDVPATADLLNAVYDRAALAIAAAPERTTARATYSAAIRRLIEGLAVPRGAEGGTPDREAGKSVPNHGR